MKLSRYKRELAAATAYAVLLAVVAVLAPTFFSAANLRDLAVNNARLNFPPLIVTLGTFSLFRGMAEGLTRGIENYSGFSPQFLFLGQGYVGAVIPAQFFFCSRRSPELAGGYIAQALDAVSMPSVTLPRGRATRAFLLPGA